MAYDPDFKVYSLFVGNPGHTYFTEVAGVRTVAEPYFVEEGPSIGCEILRFASLHEVFVAEWHSPITGHLVQLGDIRTAIDAILAAHPEVTHFTFEPFLNWIYSRSDRYTTTCPRAPSEGGHFGFAYSYSEWQPPYSTNDSSGHLVSISTPSEIDFSWWYIDGDPAEFAMGLPGRGLNGADDPYDWFASEAEPSVPPNPHEGEYLFPGGSSWYSDEPGVNTVTEPSVAGEGTGPTIYFLRPTALTWPGQDAANHANRIFWSESDIAVGAAEVNMAGKLARWGHHPSNENVLVRGYVGHEASEPDDSEVTICFV